MGYLGEGMGDVGCSGVIVVPTREKNGVHSCGTRSRNVCDAVITDMDRRVRGDVHRTERVLKDRGMRLRRSHPCRGNDLFKQGCEAQTIAQFLADSTTS